METNSRAPFTIGYRANDAHFFRFESPAKVKPSVYRDILFLQLSAITPKTIRIFTARDGLTTPTDINSALLAAKEEDETRKEEIIGNLVTTMNEAESISIF